MDGIIQAHQKLLSKKEKKKNKKNKRDTKTKGNESGSESESSSSSDSELSETELKEAEKLLTPEEKARLNLKQQRESLPIYPYRDQLLAALRDH